jgi:hypothetical protein
MAAELFTAIGLGTTVLLGVTCWLEERRSESTGQARR